MSHFMLGVDIGTTSTGDYCVTLDGHALDGDLIPLTDDGNEHQVVVELRSRAVNA